MLHRNAVRMERGKKGREEERSGVQGAWRSLVGSARSLGEQSLLLEVAGSGRHRACDYHPRAELVTLLLGANANAT